MTVEANDIRHEYPGNDVATVFTGPRAFSADHVKVYLVDAAGVSTLQTDYTISGVGKRNTVVTMDTAPAAGLTVVLVRTVPYEQATNLTGQGAYLPETVEEAMDLLVMQVQQVNALLTEDGDPVVPDWWLPGWGTDESALDDLIAAEAAKGSALVTYLPEGTGAVSRSSRNKMGDILSVLDFLPVSQHAAILDFTSVYDCSAGIAAAYTRAKAVRGRLECPAGLFNVSETITLDGTAGFVGAGTSGANLDLETIDDLASTVFRWIGVAGGTVINQTGRIGGIDLGNFTIDCANLADVGIQLDRLTYSRVLPIKAVSWRADQVGKGGVVISPNPMFSADNCMFNEFSALYLRGPTCCIRFTTADGSMGNGCHNAFRVLVADCRGGTANSGIVIEDADNNSFQMTYTAVFNYPTDYGLVFEGAAARANYFFHFQGAAHAKAGSKNAIYAFDRENGQPQPTVEAGAELFWSETGNNATGWNLTQPMNNLKVSLTGDVATTGVGVDPSRVTLHRESSNSLTFIGFDASNALGVAHSATGEAVIGYPIRIGNNRLGFFNEAPIGRPTITGSKGGNAALTSLLSALEILGLVTDGTT